MCPGPAGMATTDRALALADRAGTVTRLSAVPLGPYVHVRASRDGARLVIGSDEFAAGTAQLKNLATQATTTIDWHGDLRVLVAAVRSLLAARSS